LRAGRTEFIGGVLTETTGVLTIQGDLTEDHKGDPVHVKTDYLPSSYTLNTGTLSAGTITDVQKMYDGNTLDIAEVTGVPGFDIEFNFTNIKRLPEFVVARWQYDGSATHFVTIDLYNYTPKANQGDYVDASGNAIVRFYHHTSGNASHDIHIDYVGLTTGDHK
jgi:hypothetical protein